jgi:hypothetical protein
MADPFLNDDGIEHQAIPDTFARFIFLLLTVMIAIGLGLMVAWITPRF